MKKMKRDLLPWAFILFLSLGLAYWASIPVSETSTSKVAIVTIPESTISTIELSAPDSKVLAKRRSDINDRWWISSERKGQAASAGQIESSATNERFMASAKFKDMLAQLSPFQALRVIGKVSDEQLQEFGLRDSLKSMIIKDSAGASLLSLLIGKQLYGSRNHYVLNQADQKVLLVSGDFINDFEKPELRVFERSISAISPEEIQTTLISAGGKSKKFSHTKRDSKGALVWTVEGGSGDPVAIASTWFDKFAQLKAAMYATDAEEVSLNSIPALFELEINGVGTATETIQVRKRMNAGSTEFWLTGSYLKWNVKVAATRAEVLEKDLHQLLGN